jgi:hypothetical protein
MNLRESIVIAAEAKAVWPFVADPALQGNWNPKIVLVDRNGSGPAQAGEQFEVIYRMTGKEKPSHVKVIASEPPHRIVFRHCLAGTETEQIVMETYELSNCHTGVRLVQTIDLTRSRIPWLFHILIWFINSFGRHMEEPYLERLKQIVEQSTATRE